MTAYRIALIGKPAVSDNRMHTRDIWPARTDESREAALVFSGPNGRSVDLERRPIDGAGAGRVHRWRGRRGAGLPRLPRRATEVEGPPKLRCRRS